MLFQSILFPQSGQNEKRVKSVLRRRSAYCLSAVSYTHLDVYKRQGHNVVTLALGAELAAVRALDVAVMQSAVSYTHLDVYKRQCQYRCPARSFSQLPRILRVRPRARAA